MGAQFRDRAGSVPVNPARERITGKGDGTMRKIIEYTLVSADGIIGDSQNWGLANFQDDAYMRDGLGQLLACDAMLIGRNMY